MKQNRILVVVLVLFLGAAGLAVWNAQQQIKATRDVAPANNAGNGHTAGDAVGENASFTITEAEHKKWVIHAHRADYTQKGEGATLSEVTGEIYNDSGAVSLTFQAPSGLYNNQARSIVLLGAPGNPVIIKATDKNGGQLTAPKVSWRVSQQQVVAEGGIKLTKPGAWLSTANRCRFSMDFGSIALEGGAVTQVTGGVS